MFHLLDQAELTFPFERAMTFRDLESNEEILAVPAAVRGFYLEQIEQLKDQYTRTSCGRRASTTRCSRPQRRSMSPS